MYSAPLPKGRPSTHRRTGGFVTPVHVPVTYSPQPPKLPPEAGSAAPTYPDPADDDESSLSACYTSATATVPGVGPATGGGTPATWPFSDETAFFQPAAQLDLSPSSSSSWSALANSSNLGLLSEQPPNPVIRSSLTGGGAEVAGGADSLASYLNVFTSTADSLGLSSIPEPLTVNNHESSAYPLPRLSPPIVDETETCVRELSDLTVRLYPVYRMSWFITVSGQPNPGALLTATAFNAVKILLEEPPHVKPPAQQCNFLHEIFSTSRTLLDIMYRIQANSAVTTDTATASSLQERTTTSLTPALSTIGAEDNSDNWMSTLSCLASPVSGAVSLPPHPAVSATTNNLLEGVNLPPIIPPPTAGTEESSAHQHVAGGDADRGAHSISVCYLILASYTRLLHVYSTLVTVLQDDVSQAKVIDPRLPRPWMVELRISLLFQFIAQLFERMQQVIKAYLSEVDNGLDAAKVPGAKHTSKEWPSQRLDGNLVGLGNIADMERTIRDKLKQLQANL